MSSWCRCRSSNSSRSTRRKDSCRWTTWSIASHLGVTASSTGSPSYIATTPTNRAFHCRLRGSRPGTRPRGRLLRQRAARKGGGFNLALPVQGVPVGLSLLGGDAAQGSVTIAGAKTYGVDTISLYDDLRKWAAMHTDFLANFAPRDQKQNYLRVVTRVYLTGDLTVSLQSARSASGGLSAGAAKPVNVFGIDAGEKPEVVTAEAYKENLKTINDTIAASLKDLAAETRGALPGGSVSVVAASANAISLKEHFARPLVIGYLGFDVAIGDDGAVGPPIPTHAVLSFNQPVAPATAARIEQRTSDIDQIVKAVTAPGTNQLDATRLQTVFKGTAFEELAPKFAGKAPDALREELAKAKYRGSIAQFKKNAAGLGAP